MSHLDITGTEVLDAGEAARLAADLAEIGPWKLSGTHGVLRAERGGTARHEQSSTTADGLLEAVRWQEARLTALEAEQPTRTVITGEGEPLDEHEFAAAQRSTHVID